MKNLFIFALIFAIIAVNCAQIQPINVDIYIMSKCSDWINLEQKIIAPLYLRIGQILNINLEFIAKVDPSARLGFTSMHGESEVQGDLLEVCANRIFPQNNTIARITACADKNWKDIPNSIYPCLEYSQIDAVAQCAYGEKGKQLLTASIQKTTEKKVSWSPTMFVNDKLFCIWGEKCEATDLNDFIRKLCSLYQGPKPAACYV